MNKQNCSKSQIMQEMKSCFEELDLRIENEDDSEDVSVVTSEIDFELFSTHIHAALFPKHNIIEIEINFLPPVNQDKLEKVYDLINRINTTIMDIGTFSIYPMGNAPSLRTAVYVPDKRFDSEQFKETLKRLISQGSHFYELIGRANPEDTSVEEILNDFIEGAKEYYRTKNNVVMPSYNKYYIKKEIIK